MKRLFALGDMILDKTVLFSYSSIGYVLRQKFWNGKDLQVDLRGKICLVTGANAGLGFTTTLKLAERGATVYIVARNRERGESARNKIIDRTGNPNIHLELADLSDLEAVRALAERFPENRLDILIHNASVLLSERYYTAEGFELTFATNVLGPFLLTNQLLSPLQASPSARIIFVSSGGMYSRGLQPDDLQLEQESFNGMGFYAHTKRAQVVLSEMFAERLKDTGITINSLHPGWVDTPGLKKSLPTFRKVMKYLLRTPEQGADTILWLAIASHLEGKSGKFWFDRRERKTHKFKHTRSSPKERQKFWQKIIFWSGLNEQEASWGEN